MRQYASDVLLHTASAFRAGVYLFKGINSDKECTFICQGNSLTLSLHSSTVKPELNAFNVCEFCERFRLPKVFMPQINIFTNDTALDVCNFREFHAVKMNII